MNQLGLSCLLVQRSPVLWLVCIIVGKLLQLSRIGVLAYFWECGASSGGCDAIQLEVRK